MWYTWGVGLRVTGSRVLVNIFPATSFTGVSSGITEAVVKFDTRLIFRLAQTCVLGIGMQIFFFSFSFIFLVSCHFFWTFWGENGQEGGGLSRVSTGLG